MPPTSPANPSNACWLRRKFAGGGSVGEGKAIGGGVGLAFGVERLLDRFRFRGTGAVLSAGLAMRGGTDSCCILAAWEGPNGCEL